MTRALGLALALFFAAGSVLVAGCGRHAHGRKELEETTSRHYLDLRWGRIPPAAARVHPDLRKAFVQDWSQRLAEFELQDLEVVDVVEDLENDRAEVLVVVTYVERNSMRLMTKTVSQRWVRSDKGWLAMSDLDLH
jgi:hypothetical protein